MNNAKSGPFQPLPLGSTRRKLARLALWSGAALVGAGLLVTTSFTLLSSYSPTVAYVIAQIAILVVATLAIFCDLRATFALYVVTGAIAIVYMIVIYLVESGDPSALDFPWVIWLYHLMIPVVRLTLGRLWAFMYTFSIVALVLAIGFVLGEVGNTFAAVACAFLFLVISEYLDRLVLRLETIEHAIDLLDKHERA